MSGDRTALNIPALSDDLEDFAPRSKQSPATEKDKRAVDAISAFPSREPGTEAQMNLKGPKPILDRFKAMCKADRRPYYDMLEILMDEFEKPT